jgi:SAM-dependent methyltransferase
MARDIPNFDLTTAMAELYKTNEYYVSVPAGDTAPEDDTYWTKSVDPDGKERDRFAERDQYLENIGPELEFIAGLTPGRVLDIGCGPGWLLSAIDPAWEKHGVELSAAAAEHATQYGEIFVGPFESADYAPGSFDLIVMYHVIEHLPDPVDAVQRACALLRDGGRLVLGTPDFDSGCARRYGNQYRMLHDPTHISLFSNDSMHRVLRDNGFQIEQVEYPYFETQWFDRENLLKMLNTDGISPPFYGNFMTFYASPGEG